VYFALPTPESRRLHCHRDDFSIRIITKQDKAPTFAIISFLDPGEIDCAICQIFLVDLLVSSICFLNVIPRAADTNLPFAKSKGFGLKSDLNQLIIWLMLILIGIHIEYIEHWILIQYQRSIIIVMINPTDTSGWSPLHL